MLPGLKVPEDIKGFCTPNFLVVARRMSNPVTSNFEELTSIARKSVKINIVHYQAKIKLNLHFNLYYDFNAKFL